MAPSPAQERWLELWGSRRPATRLTVALPPDGACSPAELRDRLAALARRHDLAVDGLEVASTGPTLTIEAPSSLLDAASALRLASELLGEAPAERAPYHEIAAWWRETLAMRREDGVVHWDDIDLGLGPAMPRLPWGPSSRASEFQPRFEALDVDAALRSAVTACAARLGVTAADLLCAAWFVLCARWMDGELSILADTHGGRTLEELAAVVGPLERVLPLRLSYDPALPFERLARHVGAQRDLAAAFQDYYLLPAGHGYLPFSFVHRAAQLGAGAAPARITALTSLLEPFALQLEACATPDAWLVHVGTDAALFSGAEAAAIRASFLALLGALVQDPSLPLGEPPLLAHAGEVVAAAPRAPAWPADPAAEIFARLEARIRETPDRLAVFDGERQITYAALGREVERLSAQLMSRGVRPGEAVGFRMRTGAPAIVALLAILRAGAAYVPIDPALPEARARFMVQDCAARFVLVPCDREAGWAEIEAVAPTPEPPSALTGEGAERAAYILYTSGSTGRPRGVLVPHRAIVSLVDALGPPIYDQLPEGLRVSQLASLSFDASVQQIFGALLRGHTLVPIDAEVKRDPVRLVAALHRHRVDVVDCTPSLFDLLLRYAPDELGALPARQWIIGGEALAFESVERFYRPGGAAGVRIANVYGLTECGVDSTVMPIDAGWAGVRRRDVPIGVALGHAEVLLLDPRGRPLPCGAVGEICIGGPGLALGYLHDDEATRQRFGAHPWRAGARLFRTGDRGYRDGDGLLHFAERRDEQVKLRGHRVDLGEIRHAILAHPRVEQAAVLLHARPGGRDELAAFVVGSHPPAARELRSHLQGLLSEPMIPRHVLAVDALPLTVSGKLDRSALLAKLTPEEPAHDLAGGPEAVITRLFQRVLGDASLGPGDDFFAAGGNSLLALEAATEISHALGVNLELRAIYRHGTAGALTRALARGDAAGGRIAALRPTRAAALDVVFLPPVLGVAQIFAPLAGRLPETCNPWGVDYGLEGRPIEGSIEPSIQALGAALLEEMLARITAPGLVLVGHSIGAAVAFELARLLEARGHAPKLVVIDSMPGRRGGPAPALPRAVQGDPRASERAARMAAMARDYELQGAVSCDIVALEARDNAVRLEMEGWRPHTRGRFRRTSIPGTHDSLLEPAHLPMLSIELHRALAFLVPDIAGSMSTSDVAKESPC